MQQETLFSHWSRLSECQVSCQWISHRSSQGKRYSSPGLTQLESGISQLRSFLFGSFLSIRILTFFPESLRLTCS